MSESVQRVTLHRPATYQIRVPGRLDEAWNEWNGRMEVTFETDENDLPITILTGALDQAGLQGLLRRLYAIGLPLISVICLPPEHPASIGTGEAHEY